MAVIGQTTRMDAMDLLEKRMKSRFSHRVIFCPPLKSQEECVELVRRVTQLPARQQHLETLQIRTDRSLSIDIIICTDTSSYLDHGKSILEKSRAFVPQI